MPRSEACNECGMYHDEDCALSGPYEKIRPIPQRGTTPVLKSDTMIVRNLVKLLEERMETSDYRGAKELILRNRDEAAKAAKLVRREHRYIVKALVLDVIRDQRQES